MENVETDWPAFKAGRYQKVLGSSSSPPPGKSLKCHNPLIFLLTHFGERSNRNQCRAPAGVRQRSSEQTTGDRTSTGPRQHLFAHPAAQRHTEPPSSVTMATTPHPRARPSRQIPQFTVLLTGSLASGFHAIEECKLGCPTGGAGSAGARSPWTFLLWEKVCQDPGPPTGPLLLVSFSPVSPTFH